MDDAQHGGDNAERRRRVGDRLKGIGDLHLLGVMGLDFLVDQRFHLIGILGAEHHHAQIVA